MNHILRRVLRSVDQAPVRIFSRESLAY